jgi:leader peptidase (prepilin peptidase)/N-methyltransferase
MLLLDFLAKDAFGLGDVKLMAAAGFLLGWYGALVAAFIGLVVGGVYGIFLIVVRHKGRKSHFAFGPALCIGICVSYAGLMV